jgi:signal transduction histidine kinase
MEFMTENLTNYALIVSISTLLLLCYFMLRQTQRPPLLQRFAVVALLLLADLHIVLGHYNGLFPEHYQLWAMLHLGIGAWLFAWVFRTVSLQTSSGPYAAFTRIFWLSSATIFLFWPLAGKLADAYGLPFIPVDFSLYAAIFALFFSLVTVAVFYRLYHDYYHQRDAAMRVLYERLIYVLLPLSVVLVAAFWLMPHMEFGGAIYLAAALPLALVLFFSLIRYQILSIDPDEQHLAPLFFFIALLVGLFFLKYEGFQELRYLYAAVPFLLLAAFAGDRFIRFTQQMLQGQNVTVGENRLEENIESLSEHLNELVSQAQLWSYLAEFYKECLRAPKVAVLTVVDEITPLDIAYNDGFDANALSLLRRVNQSALLDRLEKERQILVRSKLPITSDINVMLNNADVHFVIPLLAKEELVGIILIGGFTEGAVPALSQQDLRTLRMVSTQAAFALEKIRTLEKMLQAQKMAGLGMFASQLAHDFRSFIALTRLQLKKNPNPRLEKHAVYMEKMVNDLLNYARPQELSPKPADINHVIEMSLEMVDVPPHITVEKHYDDNLPLLMLDVNQIRRVFTNLFENSIRAMRVNPAGRLKITTKLLRSISRRSPNRWVHVEILDDGIGIEEEYLERIFEPFFTTHKTEGGSGFGLAIVKQIIERHSGHIDATSRLGRGTVFNIRLPFSVENNGKPNQTVQHDKQKIPL